MQKVAVIGAGTMGNGIAHVFAQHGFSVHLVDVSQQALDKALDTINRKTAIHTAKVFAIDMDRAQQSYFANWSPSREHQDELVCEAQQRMEDRFRDRLTVEEVIRGLPVSRRNFIRRFKIATGVTPIEYLQRLRIEAAKRMLEQKQENITGVMIQAGYEDAKAFRQLFRKIVGLSPKEYREKYAG